MDEKMATERMDKIMSEFAQHKQFDKYSLTMEALDDGAVRVLIVDDSKPGNKAERIIQAHEDLSFIGDTFTYPNTFTPRSKMFALEGLKNVHFDSEGYLIATHDDNTVEKFKVNPDQRKEVDAKLKLSLGGKYQGLVIPSSPSKNPNFI